MTLVNMDKYTQIFTGRVQNQEFCHVYILYTVSAISAREKQTGLDIKLMT